MQTLSTILSFDVPDSRDQPSAIWPTAEDNCCLADCLLCFRIEYNKHNHQLSQKRNGGYLYAVCK